MVHGPRERGVGHAEAKVGRGKAACIDDQDAQQRETAQGIDGVLARRSACTCGLV